MLKLLPNIIFILFFCTELFAQETVNTPGRSAEQEAAVQTEKLQKELDLNKEQTQKIHEINLRYARERQKSNTRAEAVRRIKNKEDDLRKVLTGEQYRRLQYKRNGYAADKNSSTPAAPQKNVETDRNEQNPAVSTRRRTTGQQVPAASRRVRTEERRENAQTQQNPSSEKVNRTENGQSTSPRRNSIDTARSALHQPSTSSGQSRNQNRR